MFKRLFVLVFVVIVAAALVACQPAAAPDEEEAASVTEETDTTVEEAPVAPTTDIKIALSTQLGHPYATAFAEIAQAEAALYGYTLDLFDTKGDLDTQIKGIENAIAAEV